MTLLNTPAVYKSSLEKLEYSRKHRKEYKKTTRGRAIVLVNNARNRAVDKGIQISLTIDWVEEQLKKGICQLTNIPFNLNPPTDNVSRRWDAPSLDRIDKTKPYSQENTRVVLWAVNCALAEYGTKIMLPILKAMVKGIEDAQEKSTTSVSTGSNKTGRVDTQFSAIPTTGSGQDSDDAHHHCGADAGKDIDSGAQASSGDSVGYRDAEVGTPQAPTNSQNPGHAESTVNSVEEFFERVRSQSRELDLAIRSTGNQIQQSDHRRVESLQRSIDETFQSLEKTLEELREARNSNGNPNPSGDS